METPENNHVHQDEEFDDLLRPYELPELEPLKDIEPERVRLPMEDNPRLTMVEDQETAAKEVIASFKRKPGRPNILTGDVMKILIASFQSGLSDKTSCEKAGLNLRTFYNYMTRSEEFCHHVKLAKLFVSILAGGRILDILIDGNMHEKGIMARWVLERRMPEVWGKQGTINNNTLIYEPNIN